MKRLALIGLGLAISGWAFVSALAACSDDPAPAAPAGTSSGDPGDDDDGTSGNNGTSGTTPPVDAGTDTGGGGVRATPGKIQCGASTCDAGGESECCWVNNNPDAGQCAPLGCNFPIAAELKCDDSADCPGGQKCCYGAGVGSCQATCGVGQIQLCNITSECGTADGGCAVRNCDFGDARIKVRMCGTNAADPACN